MLTTGQELWVTTDYEHKGDAEMIAMSYPHLARDVSPGTQVLAADGAIVMVGVFGMRWPSCRRVLLGRVKVLMVTCGDAW